ncbi:hypothetical protein JWG44_12605 [Leptospira sp. 201903071]|uniref:hypothetical protein n=1 Tax=Leptospira ainazelensis TaxID=2810034 RepID=UPI0019657A40|nr:hypothetical protein [Leptospira ainazelensis]MBM9501093.1 hypothetical protein [Leptospira ainazelensis]
MFNATISFLLLWGIWRIYLAFLRLSDFFRTEVKLDKYSVENGKIRATEYGIEQLNEIKSYSEEIMALYPEFYSKVDPYITNSQYRLKSLIIDRSNTIIDAHLDPISGKSSKNIKETAARLVFSLNLIGEIKVLSYLCQSEDRKFREEFIQLRKYKPFKKISKREIRKIYKDFFDLISYTSAHLGSTKFQALKTHYLFISNRIISYGYLFSIDTMLKNIVGKD